MCKYTYSFMSYSYNYLYQNPYFCKYDPNIRFISTHINVCIHKYKYSYICNYVLSSDKSPLRFVVNKKCSKTLSAIT